MSHFRSNNYILVERKVYLPFLKKIRTYQRFVLFILDSKAISNNILESIGHVGLDHMLGVIV